MEKLTRNVWIMPAFQFPLSERTNCNALLYPFACHSRPLSVSSIGTNELQPCGILTLIPFGMSFSFLYRNERTATTKCSAPRNPLLRFQFPLSERTNCNVVVKSSDDSVTYSAFSFLYRNERTATLNVRGGDDGYLRFQFPLSERTNCNVARVVLYYLQPETLSVSSIGTNELQHMSVGVESNKPAGFQFPLSERTNCNNMLISEVRRKIDTFSFLYRNERTATWRWRVFAVWRRTAFSFLYRNERTATPQNQTHSPRSDAFQFPLSERTNCNLVAYRVMQPMTMNFQFPLSERTNCNHRHRAFLLNQRVLSVSSIGTNELQPTKCSAPRNPLLRFQFPLSERTNCNVQCWQCPFASIVLFQFPLSERTNCNDIAQTLPDVSFFFQFPLSERTNCNHVSASARFFARLAFSFLYRNERTATWQAYTLDLSGYVFQFPLSERTNCNNLDTVRIINALSSFSFLYRNERTATGVPKKRYTWQRAFQFPLSERTNCNARFRL